MLVGLHLYCSSFLSSFPLAFPCFARYGERLLARSRSAPPFSLRAATVPTDSASHRCRDIRSDSLADWRSTRARATCFTTRFEAAELNSLASLQLAEKAKWCRRDFHCSGTAHFVGIQSESLRRALCSLGSWCSLACCPLMLSVPLLVPLSSHHVLLFVRLCVCRCSATESAAPCCQRARGARRMLASVQASLRRSALQGARCRLQRA